MTVHHPSLRSIRSCVTDMRKDGIDLAKADSRQIKEVVHRHLDYFQLMIGYDSSPREIIALVKRTRKHGR